MQPQMPQVPDDIIPVTQPPPGVNYGDVVKIANSSTVYLYGFDGYRHPFPLEIVYFSWFADWSGIKIITPEQLAAMPLGKNVLIRPGTYLIKVTSVPDVYAVEPGGVIRWIASEEIAIALYGPDWATLVVDINDAFFTDYILGAPLDTMMYPVGSLFQYAGDSVIYYVSDGNKREITSAGVAANRFRLEFVRPAPGTLVMPDGAVLNTGEFYILYIY